jgi:tetratricopeptide (TPR) repeat protein
MTVIIALVLSLSVAAGQTPDPRVEAERLAASGAYEEALKRFQALAAANPEDTAARLWIGRLHLRMGHPRRAAAVFESLIATDDKNVDALAGLGSALVEIGDWKGAADALNRAESLSPDRIDVMAAQGRLHGATGHASLALAYYGRALAAEPGNVEVRAASDALRASRAHRVALGYNFQRPDSSLGDLNSGSIDVNARVNDAVRLFATGELLRSEDSDEGRGGAGFEWFVHPRVLLRGGALIGGNIWLPEVDAFAEATFHRRRAHWTLTARVFDFSGADLWIGGPGLAFDVTPRLTLQAQYLRGRTRFDLGQSITSDNLMLGVHGRPADRLTAFVEFRHGIDRLDWLTADRLTAGEAETIAAGGALEMTPFVSLGAEYDRQDRPSDFIIQRARALLTIRF